MRDFGFAFNDNVFADRVLRIEIVSEDYMDSEHPEPERVKTLHLSSVLLAEKSTVFYKMFKNGMKESHQDCLTLKINASEEGALMDLLHFIYTNSLSSATSQDHLLNVLMIADKFQVTSCMRYCSDLLSNLPVSQELALVYLELPASDALQPIKQAAKQYLVSHYKNFTKCCRREALSLPLHALEVVLSSEELQVSKEDTVCNFILEWARAHYPELEERREIIAKHLTDFISFPHMSFSELKRMLGCPDFTQEKVYKRVLGALEAAYGQTSTAHHVPRRDYKQRPIKVVHFELPEPRSVVYFELKKEECLRLYPSKYRRSQTFLLGSKRCRVYAECLQKTDTSLHYFRLSVAKDDSEEDCTVDVLFALMKSPSKEFENLPKRSGSLSNEPGFQILWTKFVEENKYFNNGVLHLRAELTITNFKTRQLHLCLFESSIP